METRIDIKISDPDIESANVHFYDHDLVWIEELEKCMNPTRHCIMFNRDEAVQVRDALNQFLATRPEGQ